MAGRSLAFSYGDYDVIDASTGDAIGRFSAPPSVSYDELLLGCPVGCLTVAYDQFAVGKRYMPSVTRGQDWGLWLELTRSGTVAEKFPGCHCSYAVSAHSLSKNKLRKAMDIYQIYRRQEQLGRFTSARLLFRHAYSAVTKSY